MISASGTGAGDASLASSSPADESDEPTPVSRTSLRKTLRAIVVFWAVLFLFSLCFRLEKWRPLRLDQKSSALENTFVGYIEHTGPRHDVEVLRHIQSTCRSQSNPYAGISCLGPQQIHVPTWHYDCGLAGILWLHCGDRQWRS